MPVRLCVGPTVRTNNAQSLALLSAINQLLTRCVNQIQTAFDQIRNTSFPRQNSEHTQSSFQQLTSKPAAGHQQKACQITLQSKQITKQASKQASNVLSFSIFGRVQDARGLQFDGNASLSLEIHVVEQLRLHIARRNRLCRLQ